MKCDILVGQFNDKKKIDTYADVFNYLLKPYSVMIVNCYDLTIFKIL